MATATFPPDLPVSVPSTSVEPLSLEPRGDVLYEVVDGRIVELPPTGAYESDIANLLAQLVDEHAARVASVGLLSNCCSGSTSPRTSNGDRTWRLYRRVGGRTANVYPRERPGT